MLFTNNNCCLSKVRIPRSPSSTGRVSVVSYVDVLKGGAEVGKRVAIIGAGGIGFDVADFLTHPVRHSSAKICQIIDLYLSR